MFAHVDEHGFPAPSHTSQVFSCDIDVTTELSYGVPSHSTVTSHGLQWRTKAHSVGHLVAILASLQLIGCFFA